MKLILIHESGSMREEWFYQNQYFAGSEAIDLPGHPEGELCQSVDEYTEWVHNYIHQRNYRKVVLAGHSIGGAIAMTYALEYPDELKALILIGAGARLRVHPMYLTEYEAAVKDRVAWEKHISFHPAFFTHKQHEIFRKKQLLMGPEAKLNDYRCCDKFDIIDRVHEIKLPTLILCGSEDVKTPVKYARYLAEKISGARLVIVPGATHDVSLEKPDVVNKTIEEFLETLNKVKFQQDNN